MVAKRILFLWQAQEAQAFFKARSALKHGLHRFLE
jgi:hypothetical protein